MEEESWETDTPRPKFSLFRDASPEDEAKKDGFVDIVIYNRWKKAERRLYQRLKVEHVARSIAEEKLTSMDELTKTLDSLSLMKEHAPQPDSRIDDLIDQVQQLQIKTKLKV